MNTCLSQSDKQVDQIHILILEAPLWRWALTKAASFAGWDAQQATDEAHLIEEIVKTIRNNLTRTASGLPALGRWLWGVCMWKNPITTVLVHLLYVILVCYSELILPTVFLYMFVIGLWNYRYRPRYSPHMNTRISYADAVHPDELDEEFDSFPIMKSSEIIRIRYDRPRSVAGRIQMVVGDLATQGERVLALLSWRDPRATAFFVAFCLVAAFMLYSAPFQVLALPSGFFVMRHPRFRSRDTW